MGTLRTKKPDAGYAESSANCESLSTEVMAVRNLFGDADNSHFGILSGLPVNEAASFTGLNRPKRSQVPRSNMESSFLVRPDRRVARRSSQSLSFGIQLRLTPTLQLLQTTMEENDKLSRNEEGADPKG